MSPSNLGHFTQLPLGLMLRDDLTLASYHPGPNAEVVYSLQQTLAGKGEQFLFLCGGPGSGKSHLLNAACRMISDTSGRSAYLPMAEHREMTTEVLAGLETFDLLCIDDVHCIAGDAAWEQALFHLYNRIRDSGTRCVMSASVAPEGIEFHLADLHSRLQWGLVLALKPLDDRCKLSVLQLRAKARGLDLPDAVGEYLLKRYVRDVASLTALLEDLDWASLAAQRSLTVPFVRELLG
jgi:DnaA family protein